MVRVEITKALQKEINKKFKKESIQVFEHLLSLEENPKKGKNIASIAGVTLKEISYKTFRFYFIIQKSQLKILSKNELASLIIKFIRMSKKNNRQETIDEIKDLLRKFDF